MAKTLKHPWKNGGDDSQAPSVTLADTGRVIIIADSDCDADGSPRATTIDPSCGQGQTSLGKDNGWKGDGPYVNSETIPYYVLPMNWEKVTGLRCSLGDVAKITYRGISVYAILADRGPNDKIGEASISAISCLGGNPWNSARTRIVSGLPFGVIYEVVPGSANLAVTKDYASIQAYGKKVFEERGESPVPSTMPHIDITEKDSPNKSQRNSTITGIVLHNTDSSFQSAIDWLCNPAARASAHLIVSREGKTACLVAFSEKAWHAGNANSSTIGIEIEATNSQRGMTQAQEKKLVEWIKWMMQKYSIKAESIIIHRWVMNTDCPGLIWPTDEAFRVWRKANFGA